MKISVIAAALVVTGGLLAGQAVAADTGGYIGISAGQTMSDVDAASADAALGSLGFGSSTTGDETDIGFKLYGGYRFNRNFAVEGGYTDLGKFTAHSVITAGGSGTADWEWDGYSIDVAALGIFPVNERFEIFGRAGLGIWNLDFSFTASGPGGTGIASDSDSGVSPLLGFGAALNINPQIGVRVEYERHFKVGGDDTAGDSDIDLISLGVLFKF